jgi:hypothetical protein
MSRFGPAPLGGNPRPRKRGPRFFACFAIGSFVATLSGWLACTPNVIDVGSDFGGGTAGSDCPSDVGLAAAPLLTGVTATVTGQNVRIALDPRGDALDYRVYALPNPADVSGDTIRNATYRCAGNYEIPPIDTEDSRQTMGGAINTRISTSVAGYVRSAAEAQLGFVFTAPGPGLVPVYALGDAGYDADNVCGFQRYPESRVKRYTTSDAERAMLVAQRFRDDGIAFYAPSDGTPGTQVVSNMGVLYVAPGPELDARVDGGMTATAAFSVYASAQPGAEPLMRVYYDLFCNNGVYIPRGHDELVAGMGRFNKAYHQGNQPVPELHWSGLGQRTTLVVEAVDRLCPFQGVLAPASREAGVVDTIDYPAFVTPDDIRAASTTGEVYVNGQGAAGTPHAIARACVDVSPGAGPAMDWSYDGGVETYTADAGLITFQTWQVESPTFDVLFENVATNEYTVGSLFGELWLTWGDWTGGTTGRVLVTPKAPAALDSSMFLHATMEVDIFSTERRYPQLVLSDQSSPANQVVVETRGGVTVPIELAIDFCDPTLYADAGVSCKEWDLHELDTGTVFLPPHVEVNGLEGVDRTVRLDVYASTDRVYVSVNGQPYGCAVLPTGTLMAGPATVSFADFVVSSSQDFMGGSIPGDVPWYPFHVAHMQNVISHHFSNLAFSSHVLPPSWDDTLLPCVPASGLQ